MHQQIAFPTGSPERQQNAEPAQEPSAARGTDMGRNVQRVILDRFSPASVLVDARGNILHFQGNTGKYLGPGTGPPNQSILDMAREGLRLDLSSALRSAVSSGQEVIRREVGVKTNGGTQLIDLRVVPLKTPRELAGHYLVVFEDVVRQVQAQKPERSSPAQGEAESQPRIAELEEELKETRESHQATIEELESSNEELKSTNEELQSSNEELQSTNEELESSKEELQSLNEELQTVNAELQSKVDELSAAYDDMNNLLHSTQVATIFVDNDLRIKRYTDQATTIVNLIQSDLGRPLQHVSANLQEDIIPDLREVLSKLSPVEKEVKTTEGFWYKMTIMPYRTMDNRIDGAVLTFANIDEQKKTQERLRSLNQELQQAWLLVRSVFDMNQEPLAVLDQDGKLVIANTAFDSLMSLSGFEVEGRDVFSLEHGVLQRTDLKRRLRESLQEGRDFSSTTFEVDAGEGSPAYAVHGRVIRHGADLPYRILLHFKKESAAGQSDGK
jgi:two-component system CheB/CheR fusion protein